MFDTVKKFNSFIIDYCKLHVLPSVSILLVQAT